MNILKTNHQKKAFTLAELLVVISIIGILSGMIIVSLTNSRQKARDTRRKLDLNEISLSLENYYDDQSPSGYVVSATEINVTGTSDALTAALVSNYIHEMPTDPLSTRYYHYQSFNNALDFRLEAMLENTSDPQGEADGLNWIFVVDND